LTQVIRVMRRRNATFQWGLCPLVRDEVLELGTAAVHLGRQRFISVTSCPSGCDL
jgi:hypothetical protein